MFKRKASKIDAVTGAAVNRTAEHFTDAQVEEFDRSADTSALRTFLCCLIASVPIFVLGIHTSHAQSSDEPTLPAATAAGQRAATPSSEGTDAIERGRYIALLGDCGGCHTNSDGQPLAGGRRIETPFGPLYSPNLTPDPTTGFGNWNYAEVARELLQTSDN
ncbi:MAG: hypothetical protein PVG24_03730 [Gammaproteobacteria bacterium]|jgi:hypothetical protein